MAREISFTFNGNPMQMMVADHWTLLHLIREELGYTGTKEGCGSGECGACTVNVDGKAVLSCVTLAKDVEGQEIITIEGLSDTEDLAALQQAFLDCGAVQCGFCTPGILMTVIPFLEQNPSPTEDEIRHALSGNLCRCTGYQHIVDAVKLATEKMK